MYIENINLSVNNSITISILDNNDEKIILWLDSNLFLKIVELLGEHTFENFNNYFISKQ